MPLWQIALIAFVVAWAIQAVGTFLQMRHYSTVMGQVSRTWTDGFVGAGNAKATFGRGVVLLLVVSPDRIIRRCLVMQGRSVFARFTPLPEAEGQPLDTVASRPFGRDKAQATAFGIALKQIETAAARGQPAAA